MTLSIRNIKPRLYYYNTLSNKCGIMLKTEGVMNLRRVLSADRKSILIYEDSYYGCRLIREIVLSPFAQTLLSGRTHI